MMGDAIVIVANTRENVSVLIENWSLAIKYSKLIVIFLDAVSGTKWILRPLIHDKIAEPKMLAKGILSLFQQSTVS
jgi:hypothetical protein